MGIEDILMADESLFQNINAFDPDYFPPSFNFRDTQMEAMAMSIRPAMRGGQPSNATVLGSPATGKTTAMKKVFELVEIRNIFTGLQKAFWTYSARNRSAVFKNL